MLFAASLALVAPKASIALQEDELLKSGTTAPDFTLKDINGKSVSLQKLAKAKKAVIINFWQYH